MQRGCNRLAFVFLFLFAAQAWAVPIQTAFSGEGSWIGGRVEGFFQYDMDEAVSVHDGGYGFSGGSALFIARRLNDGLIFVGHSLRINFRNDQVNGHVGCEDDTPCDWLRFDADYDDYVLGDETEHFYFSVVDRSGRMFSPHVTTLPQTNLPLTIRSQSLGDLYQFDEELTGSLGGFRVRSLRPLSVPEPGVLALFGLGLLGLAAGRRVRREK
jgi:hypothetical protein